MQFSVIILVLSIKFVYCAQIYTSENDPIENVNKRLESEDTGKSLAHQRNSKRCIRSAKRETSLEKQRKRCDICRESIRCKYYGKCELCIKPCKDYEDILSLSKEAPIVGSIQHFSNEQVAEMQAPSNADPSVTNPDRYHTIGNFDADLQQSRPIKLLNIIRKDSTDKSIVLAKPEGQEDNEGQAHPTIIEFNMNENDADVRTVDGSRVPQSIDLELIAKIDRELETALKRKQRFFNKDYLSAKEIDKIVDRVLLVFSYKPIFPQSPFSLRRDLPVGFKSEIAATTTRGIFKWNLIKNNNEDSTVTPSEKNRMIVNPQIADKYHRSQLSNSQIKSGALIQLPNKRTASLFENKLLGDTSRNRKLQTDYKGESFPAENQGTNGKERSDFDVDVGDELLEYEPQPPFARDNQEEKSDDRVTPTSRNPNFQATPEIISVPINENEQLESANQFSEDTHFNPSVNEPIMAASNSNHDSLNSNFAETVLSLPAPDLPDSSEENKDVLNANNETKSKLSRDNHSITLKSNDIVHNNTEDALKIPETNINFINASHFTTILENLERKVENIADLVKKTCGKENEEEVTEIVKTAEIENRFHVTTEQSITKNENVGLTEPSTHPISQHTESPSNSRTNLIGIPTTESWGKSIDNIVNQLNKDTGALLNEALGLAQPFRNTKPLQRLSNDKANNEEVLGCSKEEPEEYVGKSKKEDSNADTAPLSQNPKSLGARTAFASDAITTTTQTSVKSEEAVACSKEDSGEYVGESNRPAGQTVSTESTPTAIGNEDVGCSKESSEYVGDEQRRTTEMPRAIFDLENSTETPTDETENKGLVNNTEESMKQNDTVGCSKEEEYEYAPAYPAYRKANNDRKITNQPFIPKIPTLQEILRHTKLPGPLQKNLKSKTLDSDMVSSPISHSNVPETTTLKSRRGDQDIEIATPENNIQKIKHHPKKQMQEKLQEQDIPQHAQANREYKPIVYYAPNSDNAGHLPSPGGDPHYTGSLLNPQISQRFSEQEPMEIGEQSTQTTPTNDNMLGLRSNWNTNDTTEPTVSTEMQAQDSHTQNPFGIFGKLIPQLNGNDSKIYFIGDGIQLPLNLKKYKDGSYQLSVDVDKICSKCNACQCNRKIESAKRDEDTNIDDKASAESHNESLENNQKTAGDNKSGEVHNSSNKATEKQHDVDKRKVKYDLVDDMMLHDSLDQINYNKKIAREIPINFQQNKLNHQQVHSKQISYRSSLNIAAKDGSKQSEISKRSPSFNFLFPNLPNVNQEDKLKRDLDDKLQEKDMPSLSASNSYHDVDESLKKIDKNMKKYYDRRYKLDNYYKDRNKNDLEPNKNKNSINRRVTLVNNVLSWMKDIAIKDAHTVY